MRTKLAFLLGSLFAYTGVFSQQQIVDITEQTIKVGAMKTEEMYFGFAEGDQIIFNFTEADKKDLKEIEILEYPSNSKFSDYKTDRIENKLLNVSKTAIYKFRFYNSAISGRICKIKIQRIAASEQTKAFNTNVYWATKYDTTQYEEQERYLVRRQYVPKTIVDPTELYINSGRNALFQGGKSRVSFPISLPRNTVEWYYQFSASREEDEIKRTKGTFNLVGNLSKLIDETGTLKFGIDQLTQPPGGSYCDIYLLDFTNSQLFEAKTEYKYFPVGTRENIKSGIVRIQGNIGGTPYIGIKNPDAGYGVHVVVECVAIVLEEEWGTRTVQKFNVKSKEEPYLKSI